jgi:hypothetical protein
MELPIHTLRAQLEAAYAALETLDEDRRRIQLEFQEVATRLAESDAASARIAAVGDAEKRALQAEKADLLKKAELEICSLSNERDTLLLQMRQLYASTSWRATRPLRSLGNAVLRIRHLRRAIMPGRGLRRHRRASQPELRPVL